MAIKFIDSIGSPYIMGVLQGRLAKEMLHQATNTLFNGELMDFIRPKLIPRPVHLLHCQKKADTFLKGYLNKTLPHHAERIIGLANGSNINTEIMFLLQAIEMELISTPDTFFFSSGTMVAVGPNRSDYGETVIGKNIDFHYPLDNFLLIRKSRPTDGFHSIEITFSFMSGCLAGVNQNGLAIMLNPAMAIDNITFKTVPSAVMVQEALQTCSSIDQAVNLLSRFSRDIGTIFLIADSKEMVVLEGTRNKSAMLVQDKDLLIISNHFKSNSLQPYTINENQSWTPKAYQANANEPILKSSKAREERGQFLGNNESLFNIEKIKGLLSDHDEINPEHSICRHDNQLATGGSIIILPKSKTVYTCLGSPCKNEYIKNHL